MVTSYSGEPRGGFPKPIARAILRRDRTCQGGWSPDCNGQAEEADHVLGIADAREAGWDTADIHDPTNGQALCRPCHKAKTNTEAARGRARARARTKRPPPRHPGVIDNPGEG